MRLFILLVPLAVSACASILEGSSQTIAIATTPEGADCEVTRQGSSIGRVNPTPGEITIQKTKHDIDVECRKPGYQAARFMSRSDYAAPVFGNILIGGPVGLGVDWATGAYNKYDASISLAMEPLERNSRAAEPLIEPSVQTGSAAPFTPQSTTTPAVFEPVVNNTAAPEKLLPAERSRQYQNRREQLNKPR